MVVAAGYLPDADAIRADLEYMTARWGELPSAAMFELRSLAEGQRPVWAQFTPARIADAVAWASEENGKGRNIYAVRNPIRINHIGAADDPSIMASFFCWADCDDPHATDNVRRFDGPKWNASVTTGRIPHVRVHVYWELSEPVLNMDAWRQMQINIAAHFQSDPVVINPSRIMRVAGTLSYPHTDKVGRGYTSEIATIRTTYEDDRPRVEFERLMRVFGQAARAAERPAGGFEIDTGMTPPLDRERARIQALSGTMWHEAVVKLTGSYVRRGLSDGEIHALTDPLTLAGYTVEQTRAEVQVMVDGARRKGWAPEAYAEPDEINFDAPPKAPDAEQPSKLEWFDDIAPVLSDGYIIKGVLAAGAMSVVYGPSNSGKTFLALDMAFHVATATPWQGRRVQGAAVLYLAAEGGRGVANRIAALRQETGVCDIPFALRRAGLDLLKSTADLQHIADLVAEVQRRWPALPVLIVIDTLSRVMAGGDENSAADMTALIRNVDAIRAHTAAHVMIVHHTGKDTARGARGHSSLRAATDTEIEVQNEDGARAAMVTKQRDYAGGETFAFGLKAVHLGHDQDGDEVASCIVEWQDSGAFVAAKKATKGLGGNQKIVADTFDQMLAEGLGTPNPGGVGFPDPGRFWCVDLAELRRISRGKMVSADTRSAFNQAIRAMTEERGLFVAGGNLIWRVDRRIMK